MTAGGPTVRIAGADMQADWAALRAALWPEEPNHAAEIADMLGRADQVALIAVDASGTAIGLCEVALRHDYVNGCETTPVGFLEGIYVAPPHRRQGVARALFTAAAEWVRGMGCSEFASDASLDNVASHAMHAALGFSETERVVYFRQRL